MIHRPRKASATGPPGKFQGKRLFYCSSASDGANVIKRR
jgi:hypothetical protein